jgi:hypothetical protein
VSASEKFAQLGLELHCSNRKLVVRDYASHASGMTLDRAGTEAERRLDGDDLIRLRELCTAVHVETVDHVVIAVDEQYLVGGLFSHGADPTAVGRDRSAIRRHTRCRRGRPGRLARARRAGARTGSLAPTASNLATAGPDPATPRSFSKSRPAPERWCYVRGWTVGSET